MKPTKHAYAKIWQNRPENEHENTTITLLDHEDTNKPNSIPATPPYPLEHHTSANNMNESNNTEHHRRTLKIHKNNPDPLPRHNHEWIKLTCDITKNKTITSL